MVPKGTNFCATSTRSIVNVLLASPYTKYYASSCNDSWVAFIKPKYFSPYYIFHTKCLDLTLTTGVDVSWRDSP